MERLSLLPLEALKPGAFFSGTAAGPLPQEVARMKSQNPDAAAPPKMPLIVLGSRPTRGPGPEPKTAEVDQPKPGRFVRPLFIQVC